jgi:exoribonuclease II
MMTTRWKLHRTGTLDAPARAEVARLIRVERAQEPIPEQAGTVVEFRRGGQLLCGYLERPPGGFYRVMGVDGRSRRLRRDKIVNVSRELVGSWPPSEAMKSLQAIDTAREAARQNVDTETLWLVVTDAASDRCWDLEQLLELHETGQADATRRAGLLRALWQGDFFEREGGSWRPRTQQAVQQLCVAAQKQADQQLRQAELAAWLRRVADGGDTEPRPAGASGAVELLTRAAAHDESSESSALMQAAHLHGPRGAFEVLVRLGHWGPDENLELHRLRVPDEFSPAVRTAAVQAETSTAQHWPGRRRWGGSSYAAVNGERAYRLRRTLWGPRAIDIHMAVPALWVLPGGIIDTDAAERGTTLRLVERQIPLLPPEILQACRLLPAAVRPALTLSIRLDENLHPSHVGLKMSRVRPQARLDDRDAQSNPALQRLAELAGALRQRRRVAGAWERLQPAPWIVLQDGQVRPAVETAAELIDGELQLLAAEALGWWCQEHALASIYMTREAGAAATSGSAAGPAAAGDALALRTFVSESHAAHATLGTDPGQHAGLGLRNPVAGSQPTRCYVDLIMQRQILAQVGAGPATLSTGELQRTVMETHAAREAAWRVESDSQRYWSLKWVEQLPPEQGVSCVVVEPRGPGYLALLDGGPAGTFAPATGGERVDVVPGQRLRLRVEQVSARRNVLRLADPRPE